MHKIIRNEPPEKLKEKSIKFQKELNSKTDIKKAWNNFTSTNLKKQTLEKLNEMFEGCCCYCEGEYDVVSYGEIEHFKPKSIYPELMFEYDNMNLACQKCNNNKKEKFDDKLINPTFDDPEKHLRYETYLLIPLDERGKITIDMFDINSEERVNRKEKLYTDINERLLLINKWLDKIDNNNNAQIEFIKEMIECTIQEVEEKCKAGFEYCTMYKHNFEKEVKVLKKILEKM